MSVTGNIVNNPTGTIFNQFHTPGPTATDTAIRIANTVSGSIQNSGSVLATLPGGASPGQRFAINVEGAGLLTQGITNSNVIKAFATQTAVGILTTAPSFAGGITNTFSGLISAVVNQNAPAGATSVGQAEGILVDNVTFNGGIHSAGTIVADALVSEPAAGTRTRRIGSGMPCSTFFGASRNRHDHRARPLGGRTNLSDYQRGRRHHDRRPTRPHSRLPTRLRRRHEQRLDRCDGTTGSAAASWRLASTFSGGITNSGNDLRRRTQLGRRSTSASRRSRRDHQQRPLIGDVGRRTAAGIFVSRSTFFGDIVNNGSIHAVAASATAPRGIEAGSARSSAASSTPA